MTERKVWYCKIGYAGTDLSAGKNITPDQAMREAVERAYTELTGFTPHFVFSGWGARLEEHELAVHEDREPDAAKIAAELYERLDVVERQLLFEGRASIAQRVADIRRHFEAGDGLPNWSAEQWIAAAIAKLGDAATYLHEGTYGVQYKPASPEDRRNGIECLLASAAVLMDAAQKLSEPDPTVTVRLGIPGVNDRVLAELRGVASSFAITLSEALALVVGYGLRAGRETGVFGERVLDPMSRSELLSDLAEMIQEQEE